MKKISTTMDTGALMADYCEKNRIYKAALARKMGIDYRSVFYYLKTKSMDLNKLVAFSEALNHNFLMDLAVRLPENYTTNAPLAVKDEENLRLKEQIKILEAEKQVLLKALSGRV